MPINVLRTKLYLPPARADLVARERLRRQLDEGLQPGHRLILLCAPAGYGKSTLISQWAHATAALSAPRIAWLGLDEADNDPARFWAHVIAALQTLQAHGREQPLGQALLQALESPQPPAWPALLPDLLNEIVELPDPVVLVLDDYQLIDAGTVHDGVGFLLDHLPPHVHLVISTRNDPPLPLARLRGRGQLTLIRADDLRFRLDEVTAFVARRAGILLDPRDGAELEARTEGWAAGLQMAAICLATPRSPGRGAGGSDDVSGFIAAFAGSNRYVLDYLVEEVLSHQPPEVEAFMLQTAVLERLCGPLCDAVLAEGRAADHAAPARVERQAQEMLEHLEASNLFLLPMDDERKWYRYHHLFADLLRARLEQRQPGAAARLQRVAAAWFESQGLIDDAIHHALSARDYGLAVHLIEQHFSDRLLLGQGPTVLAWLAALPEETVRRRPWLCVARANALAFALRPAGAAAWLAAGNDAIDAASPVDEQGRLRGHIAAVGSLVAATNGEYRRSIDLAQEADALLPEGSTLRLIVPFALGHARLAEGDLAGAESAFERGVTLSLATANIMNIALAMNELARVRKIQGRLGAALELYEDILRRAGSPRGSWMFSAIELAVGDIHAERYELAEARRWVELALTRIGSSEQPDDQAARHHTLARLLWAEGDAGKAAAELDQAVGYQQAGHLPPLMSRTLDSFRVYVWLARGDLAAAERWIEADRLRPERTCLQREVGGQIRARVLVAEGVAQGGGSQLDEAIALLRQLEEDARAGGRGRSLIEILALLAVALQLRGDGGPAQEALEDALRLGEPEGFVRTLVEEGEVMRRLIATWRAGKARSAAVADPAALRLVAYAGRLLAAFPEVQAPESPSGRGGGRSHANQGLIEPLTDREIEVLELVAPGLSTQEIASKLIVAEGTVKAHLASIYRKLDVHSRTQALASARALHLLDD